MDDIIEFILEFVLEIGAEVAADRKVPKWIRYPLLVFFLLLYASITVGLLVCGVLIFEESPVFAIILIVVGLFILGGGIFKFRKTHLRNKENKE